MNTTFSAKQANVIAIVSGIGALTGIWLAYKGNKKFWGYVGRFIAGSLIGTVAGGVIARVAVK